MVDLQFAWMLPVKRTLIFRAGAELFQPVKVQIFFKYCPSPGGKTGSVCSFFI